MVQQRAQIYAFKLITRRQPVPEHIQRAIWVPNNAVANLKKMPHGPDIPSWIVDAAVKVTMGKTSTPTLPTAIQEDLVKAEELDATPINPADYPKGNSLEDKCQGRQGKRWYHFYSLGCSQTLQCSHSPEQYRPWKNRAQVTSRC